MTSRLATCESGFGVYTPSQWPLTPDVYATIQYVYILRYVIVSRMNMRSRNVTLWSLLSLFCNTLDNWRDGRLAPDFSHGRDGAVKLLAC